MVKMGMRRGIISGAWTNLTLYVTRSFGLYSEIVIVVSVMNAWNIQLDEGEGAWILDV